MLDPAAHWFMAPGVAPLFAGAIQPCKGFYSRPRRAGLLAASEGEALRALTVG